MDLIQQTKKVKKALATRDTMVELMHYYFHGGMVTASNGFITAAAPVDVPVEDRLLPAAEFDKALDVLGTDAVFDWQEDKLVMKKGRRRVSINTLSADAAHFLQPATSKVEVTVELVPSLKRIRPFISDDASKAWAMTAWLRPSGDGESHRLTATNNVVIADCYACELAQPVSVNIPDHCIDYAVTRAEKLTHIAIDERVITLYFDDGSYLTSRLYTEKMPAMLFEMVEKLGDASFALSDAWRDDLRALALLSEHEVRLCADKMTAGRNQAEVIIEQASLVPDGEEASVFHPKFLVPVVAEATHFDMTNWPKPCRWHGDGIRGIIAGRRT